MSTREVEARLKISARDATGRVPQQVASKLQQINRQASLLNAQQGALGRTTASTMAVMGRYLAPAAVAAFTAGAVKDFAAVERQMTRIGLTAGASASEAEAAFRKMQDVSRDMALPLDSAVSALDTLVSSGLSLKEAMDFLPSVLATAQASGSATEDIANTAIKASSALKIQATDMQTAFDIMVAGGKAGQFELKDMATYIPELANSFASLGYSGQDGLRTLISLLQTIREDTGSASAAATQAQNIFGKMYSSDTAKKFSSFGIDLRKELEAARKNGEDAVAAFVRLSKQAIKGDLSKLPQLFTDQEFRLGMQSLITSADSYERFVKAVNSTEVSGTVFRDLKTVTEDTQASIDRMTASWEKLKLSFGGKAAGVVTPVIDSITTATDRQDAIDKALETKGMSWFQSQWHQLGLGEEELDRLAIEGGFKDPELRKKYENGPDMPEGWQPEKEFPGGGTMVIADGETTPSTGPVVTWKPEQGERDLGKTTKTIGLPVARPAYSTFSGRDEIAAAMIARRAEIAYLNERGRDYEHPSAPEEFSGDAVHYEPWRPQRTYGDSMVERRYPQHERSIVADMRDGDRRSYAERSVGMEPWTPTRVFDSVASLFGEDDARKSGEALADAATAKINTDVTPAGEALGMAAISKMNADAGSVAEVIAAAMRAAAPQIGAAISSAFSAGASQVKIGVNVPSTVGAKTVKADTGKSMPELPAAGGTSGGGGY